MEQWEKFEQYCREIFGLDGTPGSGNQWYDKGDGTTRDAYDPWPLQIDAKTTVGQRFSVNKSDMEKWIDQATSGGRRFALPIRFLKTTKRKELDLVVINLDDFAELVDVARSKPNFTNDEVNLLWSLKKHMGEGTAIAKILESVIQKVEASR
jgi:hypothetical protein